MALYDFKCGNCGAEFEVERPLGQTGPAKCPQCGSMRTEKVFAAAGIVFKGSGFYVTDSKAKTEKTETKGKPIEKTGESSSPEPPAAPTARPEPKASSGKDSE